MIYRLYCFNRYYVWLFAFNTTANFQYKMSHIIVHLWLVELVFYKLQCTVLTKMSRSSVKTSAISFFFGGTSFSCQQYVYTAHHHYLGSIFSYLSQAFRPLWTIYFFRRQLMQCLLFLVRSRQLEFHLPFETSEICSKNFFAYTPA